MVAEVFVIDDVEKHFIQHINEIVDFEDKDALVSDPDLEGLRSLPECAALVAKFEARNS